MRRRRSAKAFQARAESRAAERHKRIGLPAVMFVVAGLALPTAQQPTDADMPQEMVWVDRGGQVTGRVGSVQDAIFYPELSPDDRRIAVSARDGAATGRDVWIHDVATGEKTRITSEDGNDNFPIWSPDGRQIVFTSSRSGNYHLYLKTLDPDAPETLLLGTERREFPNHWSPDGRYLAYTREDVGEAARDIFFLDMTGDLSVEQPILKSTAWHDGGEFSPDGRYMAYASNADGPWEVFVVAVADPTKVWKVSRPLERGWAGGGGQPRWRGDGRELFYVVGETMMAVPVETGGEFTYGTPVRLFGFQGMRGHFPDEMPWLQQYDVTADGQGFVFVRKVEEQE